MIGGQLNGCRTMEKVAFAVTAHPDDIEFMMAGTLLQLGRAGWKLHVMNVANGSCGSSVLNAAEIVPIRAVEARKAAGVLGAILHDPLTDDIQIYYTLELASRLCAVVRHVNPQILLTHGPDDYMEDHVNAARLAVTAAFCRSMPNFPTEPACDPIDSEMAVYHAMPWGLTDQLRRPVKADFYVDISDVLAEKRQALACHRTQKQWLDKSQHLDSYLNTMEQTSARMGEMSGRFSHAEGWRRHSHLGFGPENFDPLFTALDPTLLAFGARSV